MELSGKIFKVMPLETGEGKNGVWKKQQIIIETTSDKYPKKVAVQLWGDLTDKGFQEGAEISVEFDVESREYNGNWYTDLRAWKVDPAGAGAPEGPQAGYAAAPQQSAPSTPVDFSSGGDGDDLPF